MLATLLQVKDARVNNHKEVALTVLIAPSICSTTFPASPYFACMRVESLVITFETIAPAMAVGGMLESITRAKSHPFVNAMMKPPMKVERSCMNFPT